MNKKEIERIENSVKGTLAIEGKKPSIYGRNITNLYLNKKISSETAIRSIKKFWGCK